MKVLAIALVLMTFLSPAAALSPYPAGKVGSDVSWPNCRARPPRDAAFGIVGATGGLVFAPNQCLFEEAHWFNGVSLYVNTGYAGKAAAEKFNGQPRDCKPRDETCLAYDFGYNAGIYATYYAASQFVHGRMWWLDVETENSWSPDHQINRAALQGMIDAIDRTTLFPAIGFYAYPGQWQKITGGWKNGYPNWAATGGASYQRAVSFCKGQSFTGGETLLTQFTTRLDNDYVCN